MRGLTSFCQAALDELHCLYAFTMNVTSQLSHIEQQLSDYSAKWSRVAPVSNQRYNTMASELFGVWLLCRSVDLYNGYCRQILKLAVQIDPNVVIILQQQEAEILRRASRARGARRQSVAEFVEASLDGPRIPEELVRTTIHVSLGISQNPEVPAVCAVRNALVHSQGRDRRGRVRDALRRMGANRSEIYPVDFPPGFMPIQLLQGAIPMNELTGRWACRIIDMQIHMMDQQMSHQFKLTTRRWRSRPVSFRFVGESNEPKRT